MKIKDTLDLCGWELWNFCIQNHQNLEGLLDLGAGRKVFYTGNDQGKNGREVIYDGSKWKVSAYMSDVDELRGLITALENATDEEIEALKGRATTLEGRATTTEGNLATLRSEFDALNKALNEDTAGTIDTWNEIQNFVGKYDGSEDLETILSRMNAEIDGKLDLKGGVMTFGSVDSLIIRKTTNNLSLIRFDGFINSANTPMGYLGFYGVNNPVFYDTTTKPFTLLHTGNYSDLITGTLGVDITGNAATATVAESARTLLSAENFKLFYTYPNINTWSLGYYSHHANLDFETLSFRYGSGYNTAMLINSSGNVLIGATNDNGAKLQVDGGASFKDEINIWEGTTKNRLTFYEYQGIGRIYSYNETDNTFGDLLIGNNLGDILKVKANGNILIGTPTPLNETSKLHVKGDLYVEGNIIATKEVSAGGAGTEGEGGAGGFSLYESWGTSAPTEPLALGANLGYELKTRVEDLELAKTKVEISDTLVSGKPIGAITIDGNTTNLLAPATYAWGEIDGRPTSLSQFTDDVVSGKYVPITGGWISGTSTSPFSINTTNESEIGLYFYQNNTGKAWVGYSASEGAGIYDVTTKSTLGITIGGVPHFNNKTLIHSGNVGEYKAGGIVTFDSRNKNYAPYSNEFSKKALTVHFERALSVGYGESDYNVNILHISPWVSNTAGAEHQLAFRHDGAIGYRYGSTIWSDWKTIAFTDSNVASATKLETPRTIWGQSFDGTGDVGGTLSGVNNIYMNEGYRFYIGGVDSLYLYPSQKTIYIGYGAGTTYATAIAGNEVSLRYGGLNTGFILNSSGNVTIGASDLAGTSTKLYVKGTAFVSDVSYLTNVEIRNINDENYVASLYMSAKGFHIQSRHEGVAYINTILNQSGGNVLIGTTDDNGSGAKLQVAGGASVLSLAVTGTSTFNGASNFYGSTTFGKEGVSMQVNFKCPVVAEDRVTIGGATLRWDDEIKALRLNTSLAATGEVSAGGAGTEGGNTGGGGTGTIASPFSRTFTPNEKTSFTFSHDLPYYDVVVQVYEWDSSGMCWNMVLADIEIQNNDVTVTLGRMENVEHKIVVR